MPNQTFDWMQALKNRRLPWMGGGAPAQYSNATSGLPTLAGTNAAPKGMGGKSAFPGARPLSNNYTAMQNQYQRELFPSGNGSAPQLPPADGQGSPGVGRLPPPQTGNGTPPAPTNTAQAQNRNAAGITAPTSENKQTTGGVYHPKPTGATNQSAFRPIRFPGVETSGGSWAKYQDGSYVDYGSTQWKRAAGIQIADETQKQIWDALPDSWKADMAGWDNSFRDAWLKAMTNPNVGGFFQGKFISGQEAAAEIAKMAQQSRDDAAQQNLKLRKQKDQLAQDNAFRPVLPFIKSPYI